MGLTAIQCGLVNDGVGYEYIPKFLIRIHLHADVGFHLP